MKRILVVAALTGLAACHDDPMLVYSSGFTFANYHYVIIAKPDGQATSAALYGLDVDLGNVLTQYNMKVIGDKEYGTLSSDDKTKTLLARMALAATKKNVVVTVSFDDMATGRTGASITTYGDGDLLKSDSRHEVFSDAADEIIKAIQHDQGLKVSDPEGKKK